MDQICLPDQCISINSLQSSVIFLLKTFEKYSSCTFQNQTSLSSLFVSALRLVTHVFDHSQNNVCVWSLPYLKREKISSVEDKNSHFETTLSMSLTVKPVHESVSPNLLTDATLSGDYFISTGWTRHGKVFFFLA